MTTGLSSGDLRHRATVETIRKLTSSGRADPVQEALATRREILGDAVLTRTLNEQQSVNLQAEVEKKKAEIELRKLDRELVASPVESTITHVMEDIQDLRTQLFEAQKALSEREAQEVRDALAALGNEVQSLKGARPSSIELVKAHIEEAKELVALLSPPETSPVPKSDDPTLAAFFIKTKLDEKRLDIDYKKSEWEREDRIAKAQQEIEANRSLREQELAIQREHYERQDTFYKEAGPKLLELGEHLVSILASKVQGNPSPAPATAPLTLPNGIMASSCQECGATIYYRKGMTHAICPNPQCLTEYELTEDSGSQTEGGV